jgi:queuine tRNA-ribosyltransferase
MKKNQQFVPILSTEAGRCLTMANWQDAGIRTVACDLASLLVKPGPELLNNIADLATYIGWQGEVVLNAAMPEPDKEGVYTLHSGYDGSRKRYMLDEIVLFIARLKPDKVLLPKRVGSAWQSLPEVIMPFFVSADLPEHAQRPYGVYFIDEEGISFSTAEVQYIASNAPARDACQGMVYGKDEIFSLKDHSQRMDFRVIDEDCRCSTCEQKLTRAYLHHLFEQTPLLCQRFLVLHNVCKEMTSSLLHLPRPQIPI